MIYNTFMTNTSCKACTGHLDFDSENMSISINNSVCQHCKKEVSFGDAFCSQCGTRLKGSEEARSCSLPAKGQVSISNPHDAPMSIILNLPNNGIIELRPGDTLCFDAPELPSISMHYAIPSKV